MKLRFGFPALGAAILSLAMLVFAPKAVAEPFNPGPYWSFKAAALNITGGNQEAIQLGLRVGFQFPQGFAFEAESHRTFYDGAANGVEYTFDSIAAFVAYRTPSKVFWKVKMGYGASEINFAGAANNLDGEGQQFGMGFGTKSFEFEWTRINVQFTNIDMFSFSFRFGEGTK